MNNKALHVLKEEEKEGCTGDAEVLGLPRLVATLGAGDGLAPRVLEPLAPYVVLTETDLNTSGARMHAD
jgi:hypothetical protein